jgi:hypothetical protein
MIRKIDLLSVMLMLVSCGDTDKPAEETEQKPPVLITNATSVIIPNDPRHLNISILIDLSNRIDPAVDPKQPDQFERDLSIVRHFGNMFKQDVTRHTTFQTNASLKVYFHPEPNDPVISHAAQQLVAECRSGNQAEVARVNRMTYQSLDSNLMHGMRSIYDKARLSKYYPGSNIWRFMKDEATFKCIRDTSKFRNILVILTDGYMYYQNELHKEGNRFSYIERNMPHVARFRKSSNVEQDLEKDDFGFLGFNHQLPGLEVLVMEMSPLVDFPQDFDIMKAYWSKWLRELGIKKFGLFKSEQPAHIPSILNQYFGQ